MMTRPVPAAGVLMAAFALCLAAALAAAEAPPAAGKAEPAKARILFLHHSTGECVWNGGVAAWFEAYNAAHKTAVCGLSTRVDTTVAIELAAS